MLEKETGDVLAAAKPTAGGWRRKLNGSVVRFGNTAAGMVEPNYPANAHASGSAMVRAA
jgi:hypothetical protein